MTGEDALHALRRLLAAYPRDDELDGIVREAMAGARDDVVAVLRRLARDAMLERVADRLGGATSPRSEPGTASADRPEDQRRAPTSDAPARSEGRESPAVYLHGVVRADHPLDGEIPGIIDGTRVRLLATGPLAAAVSDARVSELEPGDDAALLEARLRAHDATLRALLAGGAVLPVGFGVVLKDDDRVRQLLTGNRDTLTAALDRVGAAAEWGVAIRRKEASATPPEISAGRQWLARHRQREVDVDDLIAMVHERLSDVAREADPPRPKEEADASHVAAASYLVAEDVRDEFLAEYDALVEQLDAAGLILDLSGPWPPYSFVPGLQDTA